jgi:glucose dehydrogenase
VAVAHKEIQMRMIARSCAGKSRLTAVYVTVALVLAACGGKTSTTTTHKTPPAAATPSGLSTTWSLPGADLQNTRDVGGPINASNVSTLGVAWTDPITAVTQFGGYATTPVVSGGVMYAEDLQSNVQAIDLQSGKVLWTTKYNSPNVGPDGVAVADGTVYGAPRPPRLRCRRPPAIRSGSRS